MVRHDEERFPAVAGTLQICGLEAGDCGVEFVIDVFSKEDDAADQTLLSEIEELRWRRYARVGPDYMVAGLDAESVGGSCRGEAN